MQKLVKIENLLFILIIDINIKNFATRLPLCLFAYCFKVANFSKLFCRELGNFYNFEIRVLEFEQVWTKTL